jgi:hypothetical protein
MTPTASLPPPFGDNTDDALSALLDGELAAFAADHGTTEADARAALDAWPATEARLADLRAARDAAGAPVPPLDDVTRRRLVAGALPSRAERDTRAPGPRGSWLGLAAAAVLVLLIIGAIGAMVLTDDGDHEASSGGSAKAGAPPVAVRGELGDLGEVSEATLRRLLEGERDGRTRERAGAGEDSAADAAGGAAAPNAPTSELSRAPSHLGVRDPQACARQFAGSRPVRFVGTGTSDGRAVVVVGLDQGERSIAVVVPAGDCTSPLTSVSR